MTREQGITPELEKNKPTDREVVVRHVTEGFQDSLEIGTPSKGGVIKVYLDYNDLKAAETKILRAIELRAMAAAKLEKV